MNRRGGRPRPPATSQRIIGLTGGSGSGKSTALRVLEGTGAHVIDCDALYHKLLTENAAMVEEITAHFPSVMIGGTLDRKALGEIVFQDSEALEALNKITHHHVCQAVDGEIAAYKDKLLAIEAIALIESGLADRCTSVVGILAPIEERIRRIVAREGIEEAYARARIESQKSDAFFKEHCDHIIENTYPTAEAFAEVCGGRFTEIIAEGEA